MGMEGVRGQGGSECTEGGMVGEVVAVQKGVHGGRAGAHREGASGFWSGVPSPRKGSWGPPRGTPRLPGDCRAGAPHGPAAPPAPRGLSSRVRRSVPGLQRAAARSLCQCPVIKMSPFNFQASRSNLFLIKSLIETLLPPPRRAGPRKRLRRCRAAADRWREARIDRPLKLNLLGSWFYMVLIQLLNGEHSFPIGGVY